MSYQSFARATGGLLAIVTLLGLVTWHFLDPSTSLTPQTMVLLVAMVSGLLGVDIVREYTPIMVRIEHSKPPRRGRGGDGDGGGG